MKALLYDRFWSTMGGGERFVGGIAEVLLASGADVTLLGHDEIDVGLLEERLALRLDGAHTATVPSTPEAVTAASSEADLFINATFTSTALSAARKSVFLVHFPTVVTVHRSHLRRLVADRGRAALLGKRPRRVHVVSGWHAPDALRRHSARWTTGCTELQVQASPGERVPVVVSFGRYLPRQFGPVTVTAEVDGVPVGEVVIRPVEHRLDQRRVTSLRFTVTGRDDGRPISVTLRSPTQRPVDVLGGSDDRLLGAPVVGIEEASSLGQRVVARFPGVFEAVPSLDYLDTYDVIIANSEFSQHWIRELWGRESVIVFPAVTMREPAAKQQTILSVGRFFARGSGHSKKQLELVHAFRSLCERGASGWTLHLAGGCAPENRPYVEEVRAAAAGLPVVLDVDAPGSRIAELFGEASIYWHGAGLDEDEQAHPERLEHFGITTVEAMSAGAVPVVYAAGGQREVVTDGVDGFHARSLDEITAHTERLIADPALRTRLADAARRHAHERYGPEAFVRTLRTKIIDPLSTP